MAKRIFDLILSTIGLILLSPVLLVLAVVVKLCDGGPVFFRQERVGLAGRKFLILKFRSMVANAERLGPSITKDGDLRITGIGRFLRKSKLDELPQLWNVLCGEMTFVGPRPEVPGYVAKYTSEQSKVLALKPGITDLATLEFRNEEELLSKAVNQAELGKERVRHSADLMEEFYVEYCVPRKIELNMAYASRANVWQDIKLIFRTVWVLGLRRDANLESEHGSLPQVTEKMEGQR